MIKTIVKDVFFLGQKSTEATKEDLYLAKDLRDTLEFHKDACVGMAANMIGVKKRVIIVNIGFVNLVMFNPIWAGMPEKLNCLGIHCSSK